MSVENLKPITALRFFAAMWVVLFDVWPRLAGAVVPGVIAKGYLGVELFFILSGFILCHVYLREVEAGRFRYGAFLWARLARVYPLHLATLVTVGLMAVGAGLAGFSVQASVLAWSSLPANLLLLQAWGLAPEAGWNHPSWSISAEWFAYLAFPAFAFVAMKFSSRPRVAVAGAVLGMVGLYGLFQSLTGKSLTLATIEWGALRIVPCFALGCALLLLARSGLRFSRAGAMAAMGGSVCAIAISAGLGAPDAVTVPLFGLLILSLYGLHSSGSQVLSHPVLVYLGEISYAIYMVCAPWIMLYANAMPRLFGLEGEALPLWIWLGLVVGVIPVAAMAHHLVERPARVFLRNFSPKSGNRGSVDTAR
jgi:peptidoglycan/LPS O-acetylase OafA/YrhL